MSPLTPLRALLVVPLAACASDRMAMDPTILVQSPQGTELGVSTNYGVVFLGSRARAGEVEVTAWFGDGPNVESTVVEPIGGGLYTAEIDIILPWVPITFAPPEPGDDVMVIGRRGGETWEEDLEVVTHPDVAAGILLPLDSELSEDATQMGAGVFVEIDDELRLLGLVSGRIALTTEGQTAEYLTVAGPDQLWHLVVHRREEPMRHRWVYRDDVL